MFLVKLGLIYSIFKYRELKQRAIPSIFPTYPSYLNQAVVTERSTKATSDSRYEAEYVRNEEANATFLQSDRISSLEDITDKLSTYDKLPGGFLQLKESNFLLFVSIDTKLPVPVIAASIRINTNMTVVATVNNKIVKNYDHIFSSHLTLLSQLVNLFSFIKASCMDNSLFETLHWIKMAQNCLDTFLEVSLYNDNLSDVIKKVQFLREQLKMCTLQKCRFSPAILIFSYVMHACSSSAYRNLLSERVLSLPSTRTLNRLSKPVSVTTGISKDAYLKLRVSKLLEYEKDVILMLDEIYISKRIEIANGQLTGLVNGNPASTVLCFMVKSIASKFRDIIALYPIAKLTGEIINEYFLNVLKYVEESGLNVVVISADNASANHSFFKNILCQGKLRPSINHPLNLNKPLFLIFDPTHNIKNVYNNWHCKKAFGLPAFNSGEPEGIQLSKCSANFEHIHDLYNMEFDKPVKMAHKLNATVFNPRSIEKTSVKLALAVFSESTAAALSFYASTHQKPWSGTLNFTQLIIKLWNVLNVKTTTIGKKKRDYTRDPIKSENDWKLIFLTEFVSFLNHWESSGEQGLSKQTFSALQHTCETLVSICKYLFSTLNYCYVLLGSLQSDPIEERFGWYRQMSGANYFVSLKQLLDSEKKIRVISLLKFSKFTVSDLHVLEKSVSVDDIFNEAQIFMDELRFDVTPEIDDCNIIYYIAGYIAHSINKLYKCDLCKNILVKNDSLTTIYENSDDENLANFLNQLNRGGLSEPSDFLYSICLKCWLIFAEIRDNQMLLFKFLNSENQLGIFKEVISTFLDEDDNICHQTHCEDGHNIIELTVTKFYLCMVKNLALKINANTHDSRKRKYEKLSSF